MERGRSKIPDKGERLSMASLNAAICVGIALEVVSIDLVVMQKVSKDNDEIAACKVGKGLKCCDAIENTTSVDE
jgi:hypothetical protein